MHLPKISKRVRAGREEVVADFGTYRVIVLETTHPKTGETVVDTFVHRVVRGNEVQPRGYVAGSSTLRIEVERPAVWHDTPPVCEWSDLGPPWEPTVRRW